MRRIVYPGHFNPITHGHTDLIRRALCLFDEVVVAIGTSPEKQVSTALQERFALCRKVLKGIDNVKVDSFTSLLVDYVKSQDTRFILRGIRTFQDFEYEFQMMDMNRMLAPDIEYVFLAPAQKYSYISSTRVREIARLNGDISLFVDPEVVKFMSESYAE